MGKWKGSGRSSFIANRHQRKMASAGHHRRLRLLGRHLAAEPAARRPAEAGSTPAHLATGDIAERVLNLHELIPLARQTVKQDVWGFVTTGSDSEAALRRNRLAIDALALRPKMLTDVSEIDVSTEVFGHELALPVITCPMGGMDQLNPGGGSAMARGAARSGTMSCTSCFASALGADWSDGGYQNGLQHLRDVGESTDGPKIFQLYIRGDDEEVDAYAAEAIAAGYDAFCITVDVQMPSRRERDIANRRSRGTSSLGALARGKDYQAAFSWADLERFKTKWPDLPCAPHDPTLHTHRPNPV